MGARNNPFVMMSPEVTWNAAARLLRSPAAAAGVNLMSGDVHPGAELAASERRPGDRCESIAASHTLTTLPARCAMNLCLYLLFLPWSARVTAQVGRKPFGAGRRPVGLRPGAPGPSSAAVLLKAAGHSRGQAADTSPAVITTPVL